jgi:hypothetical protein
MPALWEDRATIRTGDRFWSEINREWLVAEDNYSSEGFTWIKRGSALQQTPAKVEAPDPPLDTDPAWLGVDVEAKYVRDYTQSVTPGDRYWSLTKKAWMTANMPAPLLPGEWIKRRCRAEDEPPTDNHPDWVNVPAERVKLRGIGRAGARVWFGGKLDDWCTLAKDLALFSGDWIKTRSAKEFAVAKGETLSPPLPARTKKQEADALLAEGFQPNDVLTDYEDVTTAADLRMCAKVRREERLALEGKAARCGHGKLLRQCVPCQVHAADWASRSDSWMPEGK